ncbi:unnamed protein product, partial [Brenthis ino]
MNEHVSCVRGSGGRRAVSVTPGALHPPCPGAASWPRASCSVVDPPPPPRRPRPLVLVPLTHDNDFWLLRIPMRNYHPPSPSLLGVRAL